MLKVLHVAGSTASEFYRDLSLSYLVMTEPLPGTRNGYVRVDPNGAYGYGETLGVYRPVGLDELIERARDFDLAVSYMFCRPGMTTFRGLLHDVVGIPVVGPDLSTAAIATSKWVTRCIARAEGVRIPQGEIVSGGRARRLPLPLVVKPDTEDNSIGVSLAHDEGGFAHALRTASIYDDTVIAEEFIEGRELRVAVLADGENLTMLPALEYHVTQDHPIRVSADKVNVGPRGELTLDGGPKKTLRTTCPAHLTDGLRDELRAFATAMHHALRCSDFSLYDFRIRDERAYLIEAGLFWTFSPASIVSIMLAAGGYDVSAVYRRVWEAAAARGVRRTTTPMHVPPAAS